jgi:tetratricopeptide (TPR) repeat protein
MQPPADAFRGLAPLALAPVFDEALAAILLNGQERPTPIKLDLLEDRGILVRNQTWWRVDDGLRDTFLEYLREAPELASRTSSALSHAMANGSRPLMERALGRDGAERRRLVMALVSADSVDAKRALVDWVLASPGNGRHFEAEIAARQLGRLPGASLWAREVAFLMGLAAWQRGRRARAVELFAQVLEWDDRDQLWAIAAHLTAVDRAGSGDLAGARDLARDAIVVLREIGDMRGLTMTLTTLGRIERDLISAGQNFDSETLVDPVGTLEEARDVGSHIGGEEELRAIIALASTLRRMGDMPGALSVAREAATRLQAYPASTSWIAIAQVLAPLLRSTGSVNEGLRILDRGIAVADRIRDLPGRARLLNVLAATEHSTGALREAFQHAQESLQLGLALKDDVHVMHAAHNVARIGTSDLTGEILSTTDAQQFASLALEIAQRRRDAGSASYIRRTLDLLAERSTELAFTRSPDSRPDDESEGPTPTQTGRPVR